MKTLSFLDKSEQEFFNSNFFPRKIQKDDSNETIIVDLANLYLHENKNNQYLIDRSDVNLIKDSFDKKNLFSGIWINGKKGDGISWMAENFLLYSKKKEQADFTEIKILKEDKEITSTKIPLINDIYDKKNTFIKCAKESRIIKKSYLKVPAIFIAISSGIAELANLFLQNIFNSLILNIFLLLLVISYILVLYSIIKGKSDKDIEKCLEILKNNNIRNDPRYKTLIRCLAEKMNIYELQRILIIDDFSKLDLTSKDVLKYYSEHKTEYQFGTSKDFWIIFNTNIADAEYVKNDWTYVDKLQMGTLLPLNTKEKKELIRKTGFSQNNINFETIKDICVKGQNYILKEEIQNQLIEFQKDNPEMFKFLYLIASNSFPVDIEISQKELIKKIRTDVNVVNKEKEKYLPYININKELNENKLKEYFIQIKDFLIYFDINKFVVRYEVVNCIEDNHKSLAELFHYCNGYWAMCWYFTFGKNHWKIEWTQKLAYHLKESWEIDNDDEIREHLFDAHLLTIDKCIKYFLPKDVEELIESSFRLNIQEIDNSEDRIRQLVSYIAAAYLSFNYLPDKDRLKGLGYGEFYYLLIKNDIEIIKELLLTEKYLFLLNEIIYILLERYWEIILFLHVSDKRFDKMRYSLNEKQNLHDIIVNLLISDYFQNTNKEEEIQKIQNIALWIWIKTFELYHKDIDIDDFEKIKKEIDSIDNLIYSFIKFSEQHINYRSNLEDTLIYTMMQNAAYISISSGILINKKINDLKIKGYAVNIISLFRLNINIDNEEKVFDDVMRLMLMQSLVWKKVII